MVNDPGTNGTVVVRIGDGLGNQMFEYAATLGLAVRQDLFTGAPLFQPASNSIAARLIRRIKREVFKRYVFKGGAFRKGAYCEPHFHFDPAFFKLSGVEILLNGYFQSPRYFESVAQLLRERFQPVAPLSAKAADWAAKIAASPCSVSLHVRRGDYLQAPATRCPA